MTLKENGNYKIHKIHSGTGNKEQSQIMHSLFEISGKYNFDGLNLREYGWKKIHALTPQEKKQMEKDPHYVDSEETMVFSGPQGIAVLYLDYKADYHQIDMAFKDNPESKPNTIELLKGMFEIELGCTLREREFKEKGNKSKLVGKLITN